MTYTVGSICTGYGGLDAGLIHALGGDAEVAWVADNEPSCAQILEHRMPGTANLGDITTADWENVRPVHVMCGGFPCQPVSGAGKQKGMADERWIWPHIPAAVGRMGAPPGLLLFENVPRLLTIDGGAAMAQVVYSLAALGYVGRYGLFRASSAGAPHKRERWFLLAVHRETYADAADPRSEPGHQRWRADSGQAQGGRPLGVHRGPGDRAGGPQEDGLKLLPTPITGEARHGSPNQHRSRGDTMLTGEVIRLAAGTDLSASPVRASKLLPTPRPQTHNGGGTPENNWTGTRPSGTKQSLNLATAVGRLLHTPTVTAAEGGQSSRSGDRRGERLLGGIVQDVTFGDGIDWAEYEPAIRRWEAIHGPAPCPVEPGKNGKPRLAAKFAEWMMGLPDGWVTGVPGLSRGAQLKAIGNGVVPHQAAMAIRALYEPVENEDAA